MNNNKQNFDEHREQFKSDYQIAQKTKLPFAKIIGIIFSAKHLNVSIFCDATGQDANAYYRLIGEKPYRPWKKTIVSLCIIFKIDVISYLRLLEAAGYSFDPVDKTDYAYIFILQNFRGAEIELCNNFLAEIGLDKKAYLADVAGN